MKIIYLTLLTFYLILSCLSTAWSMSLNVGPEVWLRGTFIDNSSLKKTVFESFNFNYDNQDILGVKLNQPYGSHQYPMLFELVQNDPVKLILGLNDASAPPPTFQKLCQIALLVNKDGVASADINDLQPNLAHCEFKGDPNKDDFELIVSSPAAKERR